jgi:hypothetical protein
VCIWHVVCTDAWRKEGGHSHIKMKVHSGDRSDRRYLVRTRACMGLAVSRVLLWQGVQCLEKRLAILHSHVKTKVHSGDRSDRRSDAMSCDRNRTSDDKQQGTPCDRPSSWHCHPALCRWRAMHAAMHRAIDRVVHVRTYACTAGVAHHSTSRLSDRQLSCTAGATLQHVYGLPRHGS